MKVSIYGIGNFGYAFLRHLDHKNTSDFTLFAFDHKSDRIQYLTKNRSHPFLHKDTKLSKDIEFTSDLKVLIDEADVILLSVPSTATREAIKNIKKYATKPVSIINTAKSLDSETGRRLSEIVEEEMANFSFEYSYALLAGGTIASDLFKQEPLGADIACTDPIALENLRDLFEAGNLQIYTTTDLLGVEYAAAFKNVISILAGVVKGMGLSYGSETHIISKTAQMIADVCVNELGARADTFSIGRQCWGNDMWMSCTGNTRNRAFGILLGQGLSADDALREMASQNKLVEGVNTLEVVSKLPGVSDIEPVKLLSEIIVSKTTDLNPLRNYILRK